MPDYKGVIFDMDGTILDSMGLWNEIDEEFLAKRNIEVPSDYITSIAHMNVLQIALYTIDRFSLVDTPQDLINEWTEMAIEKYKKMKDKPGIEEYLVYLKSHNIKTSIATATPSNLVTSALTGRTITKYIDHITSLDELNCNKGTPDIYLKCCEKMNLLPQDCIVFEDLLIGITGAKLGNFKKVIAMYDAINKNDEDKICSLADKYIYDFKEMIE